MKVINVLTNNLVGTDVNTSFNKMSIVTYFLSVLKWKEFGFTTKIYVDEYFKKYLDEIGLLDLYDEVDDTFFTEADRYAENGINALYYWSFSKLFAIQNEPDDAVILADMDFIPLKDFKNLIVHENEIYAYYHERYKGNELNYPSAEEGLPTAEGYEFTNWLTWKENPINACVIYFPQNAEFRKTWIGEAIRYAKDNYGDTVEFDSQALTPRTLFAEQRLFSESAKHLGIKVNDIKTIYELIMNEKAIHLMQYKKAKELFWSLPFLEKLKDLDEEKYNKVIEMPEFDEEKAFIKDNGFTFNLPSMLKRTKWWNQAS